MTTRSAVRKFIARWANSTTNPHFAVLIEGRWGSGKTYFVNEFLEDEEFTKRKRIYISLFGLGSASDFERELYYASLSKARKLLHQGAGMAASVFSGTISVGLGGWFSGGADLSSLAEKTAAQLDKVYDTLDNSLIVVDDLERCSFPLSEFLGVINRRIEHGNSRVLLIANTSKVSDIDKFHEFREKVIGQAFQLPIEIQIAAKAFVAEVQCPPAREIVNQKLGLILELYNVSGFQNLRALRNFIWHLGFLIEAMKKEYLANNQLIEDTIHQAFIFFMEFKLDLNEGENPLKPADLQSDLLKGDDGARHFFEFSFNDDEPPTPKRRVVLKYKINNGISTVVTIKQWVSILTTGIIDEKWFNDELEGADAVAGIAAWPSWKRLWHFHSWDFSDGSVVDFSNDLTDMISNFNAGTYRDPNIWLHVVGVIQMFVHNGLIAGSSSNWASQFKDYIDRILIPSLTLETYEKVNAPHDTGFDGLGYIGYGDGDFKEIITYLVDGSKKWYKDWKTGPVADHLLDDLKNRYYEFLGQLTINNSSVRQRYLREAVLHVLPVVGFVDTWLSLGREYERGLAANLEERYQRETSLLDLEGPWWSDVDAELGTRVAAETVAPRAVQLSLLRSNLKSKILDQWDNRKAEVTKESE